MCGIGVARARISGFFGRPTPSQEHVYAAHLYEDTLIYL
jgi:hypothetical protein